VILPMALGNMREHGVRSVAPHCQETGCGPTGSVNSGAYRSQRLPTNPEQASGFKRETYDPPPGGAGALSSARL